MFKPIIFISSSLLLLIMLLISGCGTRKGFSGEGRLVKRTLRPGWHVDLGSRKNGLAPSTAARVARPNTAEDRPIRITDRIVQNGAENMLASTGKQIPLVEAAARSFRTRTEVLPDPGALTAAQPELQTTLSKDEGTTDPVNLMPKKKWNHWAIPSFLAALGTVFLAFTTLEFVAVIVGIVITLTLAGIALRRGRVHELAGKGFAIAALLIGVLAALVTVISLASYGF